MYKPDYLPRKDGLFAEWIKVFLKYLLPSLERFGFPQQLYQQLSDMRDAFAAALSVAETPATRTTLTVHAKNNARRILEKKVRRAVKAYLNFNDALTNVDREGLGLRIYKTTRTPAPVATTYPHFHVDSSILCRLTVHYSNQGSKAKPQGQHGVEIRWVISDTPVTNIPELLHSSFSTRSPFTLVFEGHDRGKTVYFCLCWENTRGEKGPWSQIESAIIP